MAPAFLDTLFTMLPVTKYPSAVLFLTLVLRLYTLLSVSLISKLLLLDLADKKVCEKLFTVPITISLFSCANEEKERINKKAVRETFFSTLENILFLMFKFFIL